MSERNILKFLWILGLIIFPTLFMKPIKERWIVFLLNSTLNQYLNNFLVSTNKLVYPVRIKNEKLYTQGSILYDSVLCPIVTVWYHQATKKPKGVFDFLMKTIIFVSPQIIVEILLEKYTKLIKYKNGWKWYHSFGAVALIKMFVRGFIELVNIKSNRETKVLVENVD